MKKGGINNKTLIVIQGPTGVGKTNKAIQIAKHFQAEIISCDSRQFYREMTIGTAVPSQEQLSEAPHHFIQFLSIRDYYNASSFEHDSLTRIRQLFETNDFVVASGGSMLYADALTKGIDVFPDVDPVIRKDLIDEFERGGLQNLRYQLKNLDEEYYRQADLKNPKRIIHALEIILTTGKKFSEWRKNEKKEREFKILKIGLNMPREELYQRINQRVDTMIDEGLEGEAFNLKDFKNTNALNTVGYKEFFRYFEGEISREKAIELIKRNSRHYAKKQLTWLKRDPEIHWFAPTETREIISFIEDHAKQG